MARRRAALLAAAAALSAGCGGGGDERGGDAKAPAKPKATANPSGTCGNGIPALDVRDVIRELPRGAALKRPVSNVARGIVRGFGRAGAGPIDAKVIERPGNDAGTLVVVANVPEPATAEGVIGGARERAAETRGVGFRVVGVAGRRAGLAVGPGAAVVSAVAGPCASITIVDETERRALKVAGSLRPL